MHIGAREITPKLLFRQSYSDLKRSGTGTFVCQVDLSRPILGWGIYLDSQYFFLFSSGPIESWFFADIMVLRGYERETGSLFVTMTGAGNVIGRAIGAVLRFYVK